MNDLKNVNKIKTLNEVNNSYLNELIVIENEIKESLELSLN